MSEQKQAEAQVVHPTTTTTNETELVAQHKEETRQISAPMREFGDMWKIAVQYAKSDLVPENYKGKPQNVIIALGMAQKTGFDVYTIMSNLNIVKGKASWSGSFCRTLIEATGIYRDLDLVEVGEQGKDNWGYYAQAVRKTDGKIVKGATVTMQMAKSENWTKNTKWTTMPELMMQYRAMAFFARVYASSAINGIYTEDENTEISMNSSESIIEDIL